MPPIFHRRQWEMANLSDYTIQLIFIDNFEDYYSTQFVQNVAASTTYCKSSISSTKLSLLALACYPSSLAQSLA